MKHWQNKPMTGTTIARQVFVHKLTQLTAALMLLGLSNQSYGESQLKPYKVQYLTKQWGMNIKLNRELSQTDESRYNLRESGNIMLQKLVQESQFRINDNKIAPESFSYQLTGVVSRHREIMFPKSGNKDEGDDIVRSLYKDKWYDIPWQQGMLDRLSQQEQVRLYLMENGADNIDQSLAFTVVDGRKIKDYKLNLAGEETLSTALGEVQTLHFTRKHPSDSRKTDIWLAPKWDYLMVRTLHVENGKPIEAVITGGSIDGIKLADIKP